VEAATVWVQPMASCLYAVARYISYPPQDHGENSDDHTQQYIKFFTTR